MHMKNIERHTHVIDATDQAMGRLASEIAGLLRGKHKPSFEQHIDSGDIVVVKNVKYMKLSGKKLDQKVYHRSTLHPGGIRTTSAKELGKRSRKNVENVSSFDAARNASAHRPAQALKD